jgi:sugar O-acyltransferase (sialic acid O-acetyltransferase NeuD family)
MTSEIIIYGGGGHGKVILDILKLNNYQIKGFVDDDDAKKGQSFMDYPILGGLNDIEFLNQNVLSFVAIGENKFRFEATTKLSQLGIQIINAIHPKSILAESIAVQTGICVMAGGIINSGTSIEDGVIINTGATVDHDCILRKF